MSDTIQCTNCASLAQQCLSLKEEVKVLSTKLDRLIEAALYKKDDVACQTSIQSKSQLSQTEFINDDLSQVVTVDNQADLTFLNTNQNVSAASNLSVHSTSQGDMLFDIYMEANNNQPSLVPENSYAIPFVMLPFILLPNKPFSDHQFSKLDSDTVFDNELSNRATCFYGGQSYSYGSVKHKPKPMPDPNNYLWEILGHLKLVLPDFEFNSILLTKYTDGSQCLGFHSDNEKEIMPGSDIVTISIGETRTVKFRALSTLTGYPEQSLIVSHGDVFLMSRASQDIFQHSVISDNTKEPRISITLRMLNPVHDPVPTNNLVSNPVPKSPSNPIPPKGSPPQELPTPDNHVSQNEHCSIYIGDSLFKNLDSLKMSSPSQKALVFSYPGASSKSILSKLKDDVKFKNLDPSKVKKIFILCGANDVDNALSIPRNLQSDFVDTDKFWLSEQVISNAKFEFTQLIDYVHNWSSHATINVINILPRASFARNQVINILNHHYVQLSHSKNYVKFISTELDRNLFTFKNGFRKSDFFSYRGDDNVHLNDYGLIRLAKHLKYFAHNN